MGVEPIWLLLIFVRDGENLLAKAQNSDEDVRLMDLARREVDPFNFVASIVDLAVFARLELAQRDGVLKQALKTRLHVLEEVRVRRQGLRYLFPDPLDLAARNLLGCQGTPNIVASHINLYV